MSQSDNLIVKFLEKLNKNKGVNMKGKKFIFPMTLFVLVVCGYAFAQSPIFVDEDFSGATDPLTYLYQDTLVSQDSFGWSDANDNMWGTARRGRSYSSTTYPPTGGSWERAYVGFDASGWGDGDQYLEYTEDFNFSVDFNFSSFVPTANDEDVQFGLWYSPADAVTSPNNVLHFNWWGSYQYFIGVEVKEDGSAVNFVMTFANNATGSGRGVSADLTGAGSLATGVNYRIEGFYRWDGSVYGQLFGSLIDLDTNTVIGNLPQEVITSDTDVYNVAFANYTLDTLNRRFMQESTFGVSNKTMGTTRMDGPEFTSDNWFLSGTNPIPEPGMFGLLSGLAGLIVFKLRRKK